jgi:hypothetical protein
LVFIGAFGEVEVKLGIEDDFHDCVEVVLGTAVLEGGEDDVDFRFLFL